MFKYKHCYSKITMKQHIRTTPGFTIVELIVVIAVIAILATISAVGYRALQTDTRDNERKADTELVAAALERYYDEFGSYPGWNDLTRNDAGSDDPSRPAKLLNIPVQSIINPDSGTKPPKHDLTNTGTEPDDTKTYLYRAQKQDGSLCQSRSAEAPCTRFSIVYKKESDGSIQTVKSRYGW